MRCVDSTFAIARVAPSRLYALGALFPAGRIVSSIRDHGFRVEHLDYGGGAPSHLYEFLQFPNLMKCYEVPFAIW